MAAYLFDTSALSEALRPKPDEEYVAWLSGLPRGEQFTSTVVVGELFSGALRSRAAAKWLRRVEEEILPAVTALPFDLDCAREYGRVRAELLDAGTPIGDADAMIAATALRHGLEVVTANVRHFRMVAGLALRPVGTSGTGR